MMTHYIDHTITTLSLIGHQKGIVNLNFENYLFKNAVKNEKIED